MLGDPEDSLIYCKCQPTLCVITKPYLFGDLIWPIFDGTDLSVAVVLHKQTSCKYKKCEMQSTYTTCNQ